MTNKLTSILLAIIVVLGVLASAIYVLKPGADASFSSVQTAPPLNATKLSDLEKKIEQLASKLDKTGNTPHSGDIDALRKEIAQLKQQLSNSTSKDQQYLAKQQSLSEAMELLQDPEVQTQLAELLENDQLEQAKEIERAFADEEVDEVWAPEIETKIEGVVSSIRNAEIISSECHATLCKVIINKLPDDASSAGEDPLDSFENRLLAGLGNDLPYASLQSVRGDDGGSTYTITLVRRGHSMPVAETALRSAGSVEEIRALIGR